MSIHLTGQNYLIGEVNGILATGGYKTCLLSFSMHAPKTSAFEVSWLSYPIFPSDIPNTTLIFMHELPALEN